jgi:hypothetical protein
MEKTSLLKKNKPKNKDYAVVIFISGAEINMMPVTVDGMTINMFLDSEYTENKLPYMVL